MAWKREVERTCSASTPGTSPQVPAEEACTENEESQGSTCHEVGKPLKSTTTTPPRRR